MQWLGPVADVVGVLGAVFALFGLLKSRQIKKQLDEEENRRNRKIKVVLKYEEKSFTLPVDVRRAELTRAEVLGRIGMVPKKDEKQERFKMEYLNSPAFFRQIEQIVAGDEDATLTINLDEAEFEQFKLS